MMFLIMVGLPGALALYYTASNLVAAAQQHFLLRKDAEEMHEIAEEASAPKKSKKAKTREKKAKEVGLITLAIPTLRMELYLVIKEALDYSFH